MRTKESIQPKQIIEVPLTDKQIDEIKVAARKLGQLKNSYRKGDGNLCGLIGELAVAQVLGVARVGNEDGKYDYDIIAPDGKTKIEVKTKEFKGTDRIPHPWNCSLAQWSRKQQCDYYVFCIWRPKDKVVQILGVISKPDFMKRARSRKTGDQPDKDFGSTYSIKFPCLEVRPSELQRFTDVFSIAK